MKIHPLALLILVLTSSTWSCDFNNVDDPKVVVSIDDEFEIRLWEALAPEQRNLQLRTETLAEESCLNYEISYQIVKRNNRIRTSIDDIVEPDDCLPGVARPAADIDLGTVENGLYEFEINLQNSAIVNSGQLVVNDDSYSVEMNSTNGITLSPAQLLRIPERTVWGYLSAEQVDGIANDFLDDLSSSASEKEFLVGNYGYFTLGDNNEITFPTTLETKFVDQHLFIINFTADITELERIIEQYKEQYSEEELELKVFTWQGEIL